MTAKEAAKMRDDWVKLKLPPCEHRTLEIETERDGMYMTGCYVCVRCGEKVVNQPTNTHAVLPHE